MNFNTKPLSPIPVNNDQSSFNFDLNVETNIF